MRDRQRLLWLVAAALCIVAAIGYFVGGTITTGVIFVALAAIFAAVGLTRPST